MHEPEHAGSKLIEDQAHRFAAACLMPADETAERRLGQVGEMDATIELYSSKVSTTGCLPSWLAE